MCQIRAPRPQVSWMQHRVEAEQQQKKRGGEARELLVVCLHHTILHIGTRAPALKTKRTSTSALFGMICRSLASPRWRGGGTMHTAKLSHQPAHCLRWRSSWHFPDLEIKKKNNNDDCCVGLPLVTLLSACGSVIYLAWDRGGNEQVNTE